MHEGNHILTTITALGANAWYVLGILVAIGAPTTQNHVRRLAKLSANTMTDAVTVLVAHRLAMLIHRYAIQATPQARQLVLGETLQITEPHFLRAGTSRNEAPDSLVVSSSRAAPADPEGPLLLEPAGTSKNEAPSPQLIHNLAALEAAGIDGPKRSQLAALPHVTPDYVRAHVASVPDLALAIWRMEQAWRMPKAPRGADKYLDYLEDPEEPNP